MFDVNIFEISKLTPMLYTQVFFDFSFLLFGSPQVSGRAPLILSTEQIIRYLQDHP